MSGQFQAWDPRSENHAIYGSKAMVDDDRPAFVSPLSLVAGLTVSWLGQPSTTTPALEGLVVTPAQINSSASNRRRHQRPGSWSTHSETAGSAQVGLHSATHSWQVDPSSRVSVQTDKRTIESSTNYISNLNSVVFFNGIYLSHSLFSTYIPNNAEHYSFWDTNLFFLHWGYRCGIISVTSTSFLTVRSAFNQFVMEIMYNKCIWVQSCYFLILF